MLGKAAIWIAIGTGCVAFARSAELPDVGVAAAQRSVLNRYCVACHNEKLKTAGLMLDKADVGDVPGNAPVWEKVVRKLRTTSMPPAGAPRPDKATYDSLAGYLENALDSAAAAHPNPGRPAAVHRLNRAEYTNSIRDLLALDADVASLLPADDSGYGFDNIADVLSVSPLLLEKYVSAARKISRTAVGTPVARPDLATYNAPRFLVQDDRMNDDFPFGSRGGIAVRHYFPVDGEYVVKVRLQRGALGYDILGLNSRQQIDLRIDNKRVKLFTVESKQYDDQYKTLDPQQQLFEREKNAPADANLDIRVPVPAGSRLIAATFVKETSESEEAIRPRLEERGTDEPAIGTLMIEGPYEAKGSGNTPSRARIFTCRPSAPPAEEACANKILSSLARRAYRRPVGDTDVQPLMALYRSARSDGSFESAIQAAIEGMLVSPKFLVRVERDPAGAAPGSAYPIADIELASRLSFFLWSSIPDEELLEMAAKGKLNDPATIEPQVRRMLADSRSKALTDNFAGQWLYIRNVRSIVPDPNEFPEFDDNLREALQKETELLFESMLREDRGVRDLLNSDYTYVNERLARHYGIPNVYGSHFRRVPVADENRKGLLGQASLLMVTSYANRTSPTLRGKWLLTNILGAPPPPPPPNVPSLKDRGEDGKILSMRQQMEAHRANPVCASCHSRMDPLGFALENFDAIGKWRSASGSANTPIDASGALPDGTKFDGPAELRRILVSRSDQFVETVAERLMTYALGRGIDYYDQPAIRKIMRDTAPGGYRWSSLISGIAASTPFRKRRAPEP